MGISIIYAITAVLSLLLLTIYFIMVKKKELWFIILFTAVFVVNAGYFALSISGSLGAALWANRISYLGSVFLPLAMLMIILHTLKTNYPKWLPYILIVFSILIFFVAASPGYLDIYYSHVSLGEIDGATTLIKEYGLWHMIYYIYLTIYFLGMIACIASNAKKRKFEANLYSTILAAAVFVNIGVWLMEQMFDINFEFLSVSYVMTSLFIIFLKLIQEEMIKIQDDKVKFQILASTKAVLSDPIPIDPDRQESFLTGLSTLTPAEKKIYGLYLQNRSTKEILQELNIKENTLKYHNKNIYSKLGVSSRKELTATAQAISRTNEC